MTDSYLVFKPSGQSSQQLINQFRNISGVKRIGHVGTLDRFAQGLMILLSGRATSLAQIFTHYDKSYFCQFTFGRSTETHDPTGATTHEWPLQKTLDAIHHKRQAICDWLHQLETTTIKQKTPLYSARKYAGVRFSDYARGYKKLNHELPLPIRTASINTCRVADFSQQFLAVLFTVSSGTYIRAFARDLEHEFHIPVHVSFLYRQSIGDWQCPMHACMSVTTLFNNSQPTKAKNLIFERQKQYEVLPLSRLLADWPKAVFLGESHLWPNHINLENIQLSGSRNKHSLTQLTANERKKICVWDISKKSILGWCELDDNHTIRIKRVFCDHQKS